MASFNIFDPVANPILAEATKADLGDSAITTGFQFFLELKSDFARRGFIFLERCPVLFQGWHPENTLVPKSHEIVSGFLRPRPFSSDGGMSGANQGKQQGSGDKGFHGAPFCCGANLSDAHEQYNLG